MNRPTCIRPTQHIALGALGILLMAATAFTAVATDETLSLAGKWRFQLDRTDAGVEQRWFEHSFPEQIRLPGGLTEQGIGDPISTDTKWIGAIIDKAWFTAPEFEQYRKPGNVKIPFWLQPELYYAGAAWFQRDVVISKDWQDRRVLLFLERAHFETRVWVDDQPVGTNVALGTPHEYDLGQLAPGKHRLTIRVDNRMVVDVGENSHSVSDHTQGNWNGIVGRIELRASPTPWIEDLQAYPQVVMKSVVVKGRIGPSTAQTAGVIELAVKPVAWNSSEQRISVTLKPDGTFETSIPLGANAPLWDEFNPALYELTATLGADRASRTARQVRFGLRNISTHGTGFCINGRPLYFRGTLECAIFPRTGHPPTEVGEWKRIIRAAKAHGLNMMRFHSWCPPEAAFIAADELGFYFHVECSTWPNQSTTLGDGKPIDRWSYEEADRILKAYGNHPSFVLFVHGNEPGGGRHKEFLAKWVDHYKARDPRRLVSSGAGWPQLPENQFHVTPDPRIQAWGGGLKSRINGRPPETMTDYRGYIAARQQPVISHEIGQWCVYPNFDEIKKYTGYLKARNFEIFRDRLDANGLSRLAKPFLLASGKLQALCYKEDIESALRTPGMGGFQLLDLHDFPGQGTALVGVLDPFWEEKGYVTAREYRRFCNAVVPLARLEKRAFTTDETLLARVEVAQFGPEPLPDAVVEWKLLETEARVCAQGVLPAQNIPVGNAVTLGIVSAGLKSVKAPAQCKLVLKVRGTDFENDWDIWVYPAPAAAEPSADVLVTSRFDDAARERLSNGGNVLLTIPGGQVNNSDAAPVKLGFSSIFWNTAWTSRQAPTTLGILCDPKHPALAEFPTDFHSNWQWWYLIHRAGALRLDVLPPATEPVVRVIDDWVTARPLGLIVEGKVGEGRIVVCGFDLTQDADDPVSRQMKSSLVRYLGSEQFKAPVAFTPEQIQKLFAERKAGALNAIRSIKATSEHGEHPVTKVVDGDPGTLWHTSWGDGAPAFPHELVLELQSPQTLAGIAVLPRQDGLHNGWIKDYEVFASADGQNWGSPLVRGTFEADASLKTARFAAPVSLSFLKLRALSGHANGPWASLAEVSFLIPENP